LESFVLPTKLLRVSTKDEAVIRRHAELSGFPATKITEIGKGVDPTTAGVATENGARTASVGRAAFL